MKPASAALLFVSCLAVTSGAPAGNRLLSYVESSAGLKPPIWEGGKTELESRRFERVHADARRRGERGGLPGVERFRLHDGPSAQRHRRSGHALTPATPHPRPLSRWRERGRGEGG